ncbi:MAG: hypothetical protein HKL95_02915, partial [Phycisphaerae bacterium]|nr:hypothetical protein [Phycisphaerae bacterium]
MKSSIFGTREHLRIAESIKRLINGERDFLSTHTVQSPRAVGDAIQDIICESFSDILGERCAEYSKSFARRAMADLAFRGDDGIYYVVDIKTHRTDTKFNMPNLTSVERLARFYEDDANCFVILMISYGVKANSLHVTKVHFVPIEFLDWRCLTIGNLGWGQIQIANSNKLGVNTNFARKKWMIQLCDEMLEFYPREISKT